MRDDTGPKRMDVHAAVADIQERAARVGSFPPAPVVEVEPESMLPADHNEFSEAHRIERLRVSWESRIPLRFRKARIADFPEVIAASLNEWAEDPEPGNLVIFGPPGTGKSHAAVAACRRLHAQDLRVKFTSTGRLLNSLRPGTEGGSEAAFEELATVDVLVWDDIGREYRSGTGWAEDQIYDLVNERWNSELPTVFTSNLAVESLEQVVGGAVFDRIVGSGAIVIRLSGKSKRRKNDG